MTTYYNAKVKVKMQDPNTGKIKKVTEQYLVDAVSVTEVETKITEKYETSGLDWELISVTETKVLEVL